MTTSGLHSHVSNLIRTELAKRQAARERLIAFTTYTFRNYKTAPHHLLICDRLEAVERGDCKRLMIMMPPRHGKSVLASTRFPAWFLGRNPDKQIICASHTADLAGDFGREVRNLIADNSFRAIFPGVVLAGDSKAKNKWHTNKGGIYISTGIDGPITGRGAHVALIDDPVKTQADAESETYRNRAWQWYLNTLKTRLMPGGSVVLIMTRWHPDDLAGRLLASAEDGGDKWETICLPAIDANGRALWPEEYPLSWLQPLQKQNPRGFASLYMQDPSPPGSAFFDLPNVLIENEPAPLPGWVKSVYAVMDTAVKTGTKNDGTGVAFFANLENGTLLVLDWDIVQIEGDLLVTWLPTIFSRLEDWAVRLKAQFGSLGVWVEDKASGTILLQQAQRRGWQAHPIDSGLTAVGKDERAISVSGYVHAGRVKMVADAYEKRTSYKGNYANHFIRQVFGFRLGVKDQADDLLDTFTYGISLALGNSEGY